MAVMKIEKDHVVGISHVFSNISNFSLICRSITGGYVLCIPKDDLNIIINNDSNLEQEMKNYAVQEQI